MPRVYRTPWTRPRPCYLRCYDSTFRHLRRRNIPARVIDGKAIAARVRAAVARDVTAFNARVGRAPGLAVLLAGDDPASHTYVRNKERACIEAGINVQLSRLSASVSQADLLRLVATFNRDPQIDGVLVQLPLPGGVDSDAILNTLDPHKDVDGLHPENLGLLLSGKPRFVPATPLGVQRLLVEESIKVDGAHIVICGRSNLVGKPLAALLVQKSQGANATVTICHTGTPDLGAETRRADILVAAMGRPLSITADMVRPGAVVIDVGTSRIADQASKTGFRLAGDVEYLGVSQVASAITPVPGGVGPMTIAMLLSNVLHAARLANGLGP